MTSREWPALPFKEWEKTCDTLHMWTQIVGKTRLKLTPHLNHWWNVTLYVTPLGLTTAQIPFGEKSFEVEFDFADHVLHIRTSEAKHLRIPLFDRSVADFYHQYMAGLRSFGIDVEIDKIPDEFADRTPFDEDEHHDSYDSAKVVRFSSHPYPRGFCASKNSDRDSWESSARYIFSGDRSISRSRVFLAG